VEATVYPLIRGPVEDATAMTNRRGSWGGGGDTSHSAISDFQSAKWKLFLSELNQIVLKRKEEN